MNFKKCGKWIALALVLFLLASALVPPLFQAEAEASDPLRSRNPSTGTAANRSPAWTATRKRSSGGCG